MAKLSDLKLSYRLYMKGYIYRHYDWLPGAVLRKPLSESRVACVTTASYFLPDQEPFDEDIRGGDFSYREIPADANLASMGISTAATPLTRPACWKTTTSPCRLTACARWPKPVRSAPSQPATSASRVRFLPPVVS